MEPKFLDVDHTAKALAVSPATIRRMITRNEIPHTKIAGTVRIPAEWIDQKVAQALEKLAQAQ